MVKKKCQMCDNRQKWGTTQKKKKKEDKSEASGSNIAMASMPDISKLRDISKLQINKIN